MLNFFSIKRCKLWFSERTAQMEIRGLLQAVGRVEQARLLEVVADELQAYRHAASGSLPCSPSFQATVGATGPAITSQCWNALWKSSAIMRRIFCACR